ncbi:MAG TPA: winged helix-turn-helix domain-containing protein [Streptosporangiaceae bacterium]|nr:winged helix-turn-helix domain-containing protein [Streptosporangiaceae bacterium]
MSERPVIDTSGPELVYMQVANHIAGRIESGELAPGARLPAERDLAQFYGVAYDTVRRATEELRKRGLIVTVHGRGTFVAQRLHG